MFNPRTQAQFDCAIKGKYDNPYTPGTQAHAEYRAEYERQDQAQQSVRKWGEGVLDDDVEVTA